MKKLFILFLIYSLSAIYDNVNAQNKKSHPTQLTKEELEKIKQNLYHCRPIRIKGIVGNEDYRPIRIVCGPPRNIKLDRATNEIRFQRLIILALIGLLAYLFRRIYLLNQEKKALLAQLNTQKELSVLKDEAILYMYEDSSTTK